MAPMPLARMGEADIHYRVHGEPSRPPVLGIMGFGLDQRFWAAQIPAVTQTHSFITFDNRGVGRSTGDPPVTIDGMAADAVHLLDHLGIDQAVIFGASMGGAVAQRLAIDRPERVSALVLAVTWARPIEFMRRQHHLSRLLIEAGGPEALVEAGLVRMFTPRFFEMGADAIDRMLQAFEMTDKGDVATSEALLAQLDAIDKHDALGELRKVSVPTLVAAGRQDMMAPHFASEEIASAIPGAQFIEFETGHGLMFEEMQRFNDALSEFLASLTP